MRGINLYSYLTFTQKSDRYVMPAFVASVWVKIVYRSPVGSMCYIETVLRIGWKWMNCLFMGLVIVTQLDMILPFDCLT